MNCPVYLSAAIPRRVLPGSRLKGVLVYNESDTSILTFSAPLDMAGSLGFLSRNGDDYLDRWDGIRWLRTLATGGRRIPFACRIAGTMTEPRLEARVASHRDLPAVRKAAQQSFILPGPEFAPLLKRDPVLARLDRKFPGIRQVRQFDLFYGLLRAISAQQINLRWAATLRRRLAEAYGERLPVAGDFVYSLRPESVAALQVQDLRVLQFSTHKAESILAVAEAIACGRLVHEELERMTDRDAMTALVSLRGIGTWSAEWTLVRCFGRSLTVAGDLGVKKAVAMAYLGKEMAGENEVRSTVAHWGSEATTAQAILLQALVLRGIPGIQNTG